VRARLASHIFPICPKLTIYPFILLHRIASLPELGPGGSWSTCANGCNQDPPQDVAHIQFRSRIAFKLVWAPTENFDTFVLVDDDGIELARGNPTGKLKESFH
jgi:hypothetical protein